MEMDQFVVRSSGFPVTHQVALYRTTVCQDVWFSVTGSRGRRMDEWIFFLDGQSDVGYSHSNRIFGNQDYVIMEPSPDFINFKQVCYDLQIYEVVREIVAECMIDWFRWRWHFWREACLGRRLGNQDLIRSYGPRIQRWRRRDRLGLSAPGSEKASARKEIV
ncbi:hypothetical protein NPIL_402371 [Nephila pilipes]|uniref:Uncharacterized protein n=1 Tax=Nephila pilipes TaxID=299642 RepID=A0A8X6UMX4_NEPPI|nr:hypothetical protein NPIL_402371 [Nephila pilipes]